MPFHMRAWQQHGSSATGYRRALRGLRSAVSLAALLALWTIPRGAHASGGYGFGGEIFAIPEPFIPDLRLELDRSTPYLVLSFPVHLLVYQEHLFLPDKAHSSLFAEPQWRPSGSEWRGVAGVRLTQPVYEALAVLADGGGLVGTDGHGGLAGLGVGFFDDSSLGGIGFLAVVWRHAWTTTGQRNDFSLDLIYPLWG